MSNEFFNASNAPSTGSALSSATMRAEFSSVGAGFDKLPAMSGKNNEVIVVNSSGTALTSSPAATLDAATFHAATDKATPVDADEIPIVDSATSNILKKLTWANLKATIKSYLSSVAFPIGATTPSTVAATTISATGLITGNSGYETTAVADTAYKLTKQGVLASKLKITSSGLVIGVDSSNGDTGVATVSTSGLAVTGTGSFTSTLSIGGPLLVTGPLSAHQTSTGVVGFNGGDVSLRSYGAASTYGTVSIMVGQGGSAPLNPATFSSTGLAVTGSVSATTKYAISGNGSNPTSSALEIGTNGAGSRWVYNVPTGGEHDFSVNGVNAQYISAASVGGFTTGGSVAWSLSNANAGALTLDTSGNLLVGNTATILSSKVLSRFSGATNTGFVADESANTSGFTFATYSVQGTSIGSVTRVGATNAVNYNTSSDYRLKTNVRDADAKAFSQVRFVDFEWTEGSHSCGVIAHELQEIYPELVTGEKDAVDKDGNPAYQQVSYMGLIPRMGVHIQKLMAQVAQLEADKATLLQVLASVDNRLKAGGL